MILWMNDQADDAVLCVSEYSPVNHFKSEIRHIMVTFKYILTVCSLLLFKKTQYLEILFSGKDTSDFLKQW